MNQEQLNAIIKKLCESEYGDIRQILKELPVNDLEQLATEIYDRSFDNRTMESECVLHSILFQRLSLLNDNFELTEVNQKKLLNANDLLMQACDNAFKEAEKVSINMEKLKKNNDSFVMDFKIQIHINPYLSKEFYPDNSDFRYVLCEPRPFYTPILIYDYNVVKTRKQEYHEESIYIDKSKNWNNEYSVFDGKFDDDYICYALHTLMENMTWSYHDIINIDRVLVNVKVEHQQFLGNYED
jgi:hypothetical protein